MDFDLRFFVPEVGCPLISYAAIGLTVLVTFGSEFKYPNPCPEVNMLYTRHRHNIIFEHSQGRCYRGGGIFTAWHLYNSEPVDLNGDHQDGHRD